MAIDTTTEHMVRPGDALAHVPGQPHLSTIWRWFDQGIRGVRLESVMIGGRRFTSIEALTRFFERTTDAANEKALQEVRS